MQLSLFQWDVLAVGSGYEALAELNFVEAEKRFISVLKPLPDHPQARAGLRELHCWRERYLEASSLPAEQAAILLWQNVRDSSFSACQHHATLRRRLLQHVCDLLADRPGFFHPPDLCLGLLLLQLGRHRAAEANLRRLAAEHPDSARLHFLLAETLWQQGRHELAAPAYARALLTDPEDIGTLAISHRELADCIEEYGPALTPIYAFFKEILPLIEPPQSSIGKDIRCYLLLRSVELARRNRDYQALVDGRRAFKETAPEIFEDYLEWLKEKE